MTDENECVKRVLQKLNEQYLAGSDFEDRRWLFDWDDSLSLDENINNVHREDNALQTLSHSGVITSRLIPNRFRSDQIEKFEDPRFSHLPERERILYSNWYDVDPAYREWDWIRTLDGFNYDRFTEQSKAFDYNPTTTTGTLVVFKLIDGLVPELSYNNRTLSFPSLKEGSLTQAILEYASWKYDSKITLRELAEELTHSQLRKSGANIKQFFKSSPFLNGSLSGFATINPQSITLHSKATLDTSQINELESLGFN
jgi:hypothetical protein